MDKRDACPGFMIQEEDNAEDDNAEDDNAEDDIAEDDIAEDDIAEEDEKLLPIEIWTILFPF